MAGQRKGRSPVRPIALQPSAQARFSAASVAPQTGSASATDLSNSLNKWRGLLDQRVKRDAAEAKATEKAQMDNVAYYTERFNEERESGAVKAVQVKEMFPELSTTVAARVARDSGSLDAREHAQGRMRELMENDDLRLDTAARQEFYAKMKEEAGELVGDNEFYGAGFYSRMDGVIQQYESQFMQETAQHHQEITEEEFSNKVMEALATGGDIHAIDKEYGESSPLSNIERKRLVVDAYEQAAIAEQNPDLLDQIPDRYLNAETKAMIPEARVKIRDAVYKEITQQHRVQEIERSEALRGGKIGILERMSNGEAINPMDYRHDPKLEAYARDLADQPRMDSTASIHKASQFEANLLRSGFSGDYKSAFADDPQFSAYFKEREVTEDNLRDHLLGRTDMNPAQVQGLMEELPKLMEGMNVMRDDTVTQPLTNTIKPMLSDLASSTNSDIQQILTGQNLRARAMRSYEAEVQSGFRAYYDDNGEWPRGFAKKDLVDKATDKAITLIERATRLPGIGGDEGTSKPEGNNPEASETTPQRAPEGAVTYLLKNDSPQMRDQFKAKYGYLPEGL